LGYELRQGSVRGNVMKRAFSILVFAGLAACASAPPSSLYVRAGLTADQLSADSDRCMMEARAAERARPRPANDGSLGGAVAAGMAKGSSDVQRFLAAHEACFMRLGYREQALTPVQQEEFGQLHTDDERAAYIVRLSADEAQQAVLSLSVCGGQNATLAFFRDCEGQSRQLFAERGHSPA
jgi:hypothetical protein